MEERTKVVDEMQNRDNSTLADQEPDWSLCPDDQRRRNTMQISNPNKGCRSTDKAHPSDAFLSIFFNTKKPPLTKRCTPCLYRWCLILGPDPTWTRKRWGVLICYKLYVANKKNYQIWTNCGKQIKRTNVRILACMISRLTLKLTWWCSLQTFTLLA